MQIIIWHYWIITCGCNMASYNPMVFACWSTLCLTKCKNWHGAGKQELWGTLQFTGGCFYYSCSAIVSLGIITFVVGIFLFVCLVLFFRRVCVMVRLDGHFLSDATKFFHTYCDSQWEFIPACKSMANGLLEIGKRERNYESTSITDMKLDSSKHHRWK